MPEPNNDGDFPRIDFHFIKGAQFRVIHADGFWGGITPSGMLHCAFFSERAPIPVRVTHRITKDGQLGNEISRESKTGVVREMDVDVTMNLITAQALRVWLDARIKELEIQAAAAAVAARKGE